MKKQILVITMGIVLISLASAMFAGECETTEFPNVDDVEVKFEGNSSDMIGFNWTKDGTLIEYCTEINFKPDNFTVTWFNNQEVYVDESHDAGQSSSSSKKKVVVNETIEEIDEYANWTDEETIEETKVDKEIEKKRKVPEYVFWIAGVLVVVGIGILFARRNSIN